MTLLGESSGLGGEDRGGEDRGGEDRGGDADGFVVVVVDPVTGESDCYGPYREAQAREQAEWRRLEFDFADLPDVVVGTVRWHAEGDRLTEQSS